MPKSKKQSGDKLITLKEAEKLFPNEWVVFSDITENEDGTFKDGLVFFHGKNQAEAYKKSSKVKGNLATYYAGIIPYDKHGIFTNDRRKAAA